jgi:hypothetical protein
MVYLNIHVSIRVGLYAQRIDDDDEDGFILSLEENTIA